MSKELHKTPPAPSLTQVSIRLVVLRTLGERTGAVTRKELIEVVRNMWRTDHYHEKPSRQAIGFALHYLVENGYVEYARRFTHDYSDRDQIVVLEKGRQTLRNGGSGIENDRCRTVSHISALKAEERNRFKRQKLTRALMPWPPVIYTRRQPNPIHQQLLKGVTR